MPTTAVLTESGYVPETSSQLGHYYGEWVVKLGSREVLGATGTIYLDIVTGYPFEVSQSWHYTVEADAETLTVTQAREQLARPI